MKFFVLLSLLCLPVACSAGNDVDVQDLRGHQVNEPTWFHHPSLWAKDTDDEFEARVDAADCLPTDHPMTQRIQFWMDKVDKKMAGTNRRYLYRLMERLGLTPDARE